jgi:hypothetical protein
MLMFEFVFMVPDVFVLIVDAVLVVEPVLVLIVDIVFVVLAVFAVLALFALALLAVSPPQAIPRAVKPKRPDSAMIFFIRISLPSFSKITYFYFYSCPFGKRTSSQTRVLEHSQKLPSRLFGR